MPQPETLTASLGMLQITATEKGYTIVDAEKSITHIVRSEHAICTLTNMQRAMIRAHEIMEEKEDAADGRAATEAMCNSAIVGWDEAKKSLGI